MLTTALSNTPAPTYGHDYPNIMHKYTKRRHIIHFMTLTFAYTYKLQNVLKHSGHYT